ncbi:hypothetical protein [Rhizobium sp. BK176]|uniref:hypothetical protein n=1 Tax=Rhizobium sp. BK176 TaxID=2587071 RepID=UPI002168570B|nr:hypothetical protein [Rhizobium sp. BK176]MCS4091857.1 hypothetical protein [Rhizobium sp. BK176]
MEDDRARTVKHILDDYMQSPSLRHLRDPNSLLKVAEAIVKRLDRENGIWQKWEGEREALLRSAVGCWIPVEDLRGYLNRMPGPSLTMTDVAQRLRAFEEEPFTLSPDDDLKDGCLAVFAKEKAEGTELPAIIGLLSEHVEQERERLQLERQVRRKSLRMQERIAAEQRLLSGADCKWTQLGKTPNWYCRSNGRTYRLTPTADKRWDLYQVESPSADEKGHFIGRYGARGDATKVVAQVAYQANTRF